MTIPLKSIDLSSLCLHQNDFLTLSRPLDTKILSQLKLHIFSLVNNPFDYIFNWSLSLSCNGDRFYFSLTLQLIQNLFIKPNPLITIFLSTVSNHLQLFFIRWRSRHGLFIKARAERVIIQN
jgi:hypothetical protein